jgi:hypothetical protein
MNSLVITVAIGLVFVFAVTALVTSILTEAIARFLGLRSEYLLRGLRTMLDGSGDFGLHMKLQTPLKLKLRRSLKFLTVTVA